MQQNDINRINMIKTVFKYSDDNPAPTAGIPKWAPTLAAAKAKVVLIDSYDQLGSGTTKGVTTDTNLLRTTMTGIALKCANATAGYADSVNNNTLKALVDFTESKLKGFAKEVVDDKCQQIHDATNTNSAGAADYGLTVPTDITDLQAAIDIYRIASQNPNAAKISKNQANKLAIQMSKEIVTELFEKQMDRMVNTLKLSNRPHWDGYQAARNIIDLGATTAKVRGTITSKTTKLPLANVVFTIFEAGTLNEVKKVVTDGNGKFNATPMAAGDYDFKWSLKGYKTEREENVHISAGKEIKRTFAMKPGGGSLVKEGDVAAGAIANINVQNIEADMETTVKMEVTGSTLRFYVSDSNSGQPGDTYLDFEPGDVLEKTVEDFAEDLGFEDSDDDQFLNVKNLGTSSGHWKMTFKGLGG